MLETLVESAQLIHATNPDTHFLVPIASTLSVDEVKCRFDPDLPVSFLENDSATIYDVARHCDAILTVSGTVTLQIALVGTPMAIFYKASPLTYAIGKRLVRVDHFGLPNIVAGRRVVPEFLQDMASPEALANEVMHVLNDAAYAETMRTGLQAVQAKLGDPGCSIKVAEMLFGMLR
jgi:lipid-A-disaccharide synthase